MVTTRPDPTVYSRAARARVAYSVAAKELSNFARTAVQTSSDGYAQAGEFVQNAARMAGEAQHILELAVILEREKGTSWEDIGQALGITKQAAHERFSRVVERWRADLVEPWVPDRGGLLSLQLPDGAEDPWTWARRLDEWVSRHREVTDPDPGELPVSGNLRKASLVEQVSTALAEVRALQEREHAGTATRSQRRAWHRRKAELFERLTEAEPGNVAFTEAAANARRQLDELDTFWTHALTEGGPFPIGVPIRVRRVSDRREAEIKSPNGEPTVQPEGVLRGSWYPPDGFSSWPAWLEETAGEQASTNGWIRA
jgi:hypothetical protein